MALEFLLVSHFLTAAVMIGLATWMLWLKFSSPVNRSFAMFLYLIGFRTFFFAMARLSGSAQAATTWSVMAEYLYLVAPFVLLYFLMVYLRPRGEAWVRLALVAGAVTVVALYMSDHCLDECTAPDGSTTLGPLALFSLGTSFVSGLVGLSIAAAIRYGKAPKHANASALVASSFVLTAIFNGLLSTATLARVGWDDALSYYTSNAWQPLGYLAFSSALIPGSIGAVLLAFIYRARGDMQDRGTVFLIALVFSVLSALFVALAGPFIGQNWSLFVVGLWLLIPPSFVAYALLRHRVIGIDHQVKTAVRGTTVVAFFGAAFFVGSELLQDVIGLPGPLLGVLSAALIALALRPIQRLARRLAEKAFPDIRPVMELTNEERETLFLEQAALVWADGRVSDKERLLLDRLRQRLDLPGQRAKALEAEAQQLYQEAPAPA